MRPGAFEASVAAGVSAPWGGPLDPFARAELAWRPTVPLSVFGFGQVDRFGSQAGIGARLDF